jgi:hypothetical protein
MFRRLETGLERGVTPGDFDTSFGISYFATGFTAPCQPHSVMLNLIHAICFIVKRSRQVQHNAQEAA